MARVSLSKAERSMFLPVRSVSDASGLCKCSIKTYFTRKTKWLPWQRIVNFGHFGQKLTIENLIFCVFGVVYCVDDKKM